MLCFCANMKFMNPQLSNHVCCVFSVSLWAQGSDCFDYFGRLVPLWTSSLNHPTTVVKNDDTEFSNIEHTHSRLQDSRPVGISFILVLAESCLNNYSRTLYFGPKWSSLGPCGDQTSTLYTTFRVLYSPLYQAAMQAYLLSTIEEKSWAQMNKNTLFLV